jgi:hypothetical protein
MNFIQYSKTVKLKGRFDKNKLDKCNLYTIESKKHVFKINNCKNTAEVENILKKE